ncbi:MAG: ATP synthase F0 subunit C [Verrucomicrobia bacterium]|nr:ATP synthase F0 subunit C [Verrucomicrobiota bacterium]
MESEVGMIVLAAALGAGVVTIGAAYGISHIGGKAMEGIARQPEAGAKIQTAMIIACALIEGIGLFCAVVCLLGVQVAK